MTGNDPGVRLGESPGVGVVSGLDEPQGTLRDHGPVR